MQQSICIILSTRKGERLMRPDFGYSLTFLSQKTTPQDWKGVCLEVYLS
ncbi:GPW/gp25 family protein [Winogradskyella sp. 3972H.M.0a.05]